MSDRVYTIRFEIEIIDSSGKIVSNGWKQIAGVHPRDFKHMVSLGFEYDMLKAWQKARRDFEIQLGGSNGEHQD